MVDGFKQSVFFRAIKYAVISASIIMIFTLYKMLTSDVVGTPLEILTRFVISCFAALGSMYVIFVIYLYVNPDAEKPRGDKKTNK